MQCALDPSPHAGLHPVRPVARRRAGARRPGARGREAGSDQRQDRLARRGGRHHRAAGDVGHGLAGGVRADRCVMRELLAGRHGEPGDLVGAGFDGIVLSWPRYVEDMRQFQTETLPLVRQAGLR